VTVTKPKDEECIWAEVFDRFPEIGKGKGMILADQLFLPRCTSHLAKVRNW